MRKKLCLLLLLCLLLTACGPAARQEPEPAPETSAPAETSPSPEETPVETSPAPAESAGPELSERDRDWISDIRYLQSNYKMYHPEPFYLCPEEEFNWKCDQLCGKVPGLSDADMFFELAAIIAGMGDIHTRFIPPGSLYSELFPITAQYAGGKLYLTSYHKDCEQFAPFLLREIVAVNGVDISYLERKFESILNPYNPWNSREMFWLYYFIPAFFDWAGCGYQDGYTFQLLDGNQTVHSVEAPLVPYEEVNANTMVIPEGWSADGGGNQTGYVEGGYVYIELPDVESLSEAPYRVLFESAARLLDEHPDCGKLVIDLRGNPGGQVKVLDYLREGVQLLKARPIGQTYILTGGYSMSAATACISLFREELNGITVGEPAGQFFSCFSYKAGSGMMLTLPQSQITLEVATDWWEGAENAVYDENGRLYAWETTVLPDVYVSQDIEDLRQGKDSVLEWVLEQ